MKKFLLVFSVLGCLLAPFFSTAQESFTEYKGEVIDNSTRESLPFVTVGVKDSNISTITNADGEFALKVPDTYVNGTLVVSYLGYQSLKMPLSSVSEKQKIRLTPAVVNLTEVNLTAFRNAEALVRKVFSDKEGNDLDEDVLMTAFYRETIKRRSRNVSLTEAVINLYKSPNASSKKDVLELRMARKSTDYKRLDTVALKLQGGPFSALYIDVMKYPEYIFTEASISYYNFSFGAPTTIQERSVYVVNFSQKEEIPPPGYRGKLYIDTETLALTSATYNLMIGNQKEASELFVKKKPRDVNVYPTKAAYRVDYKERNGKWYYSYGNVQLSFKVDRRRRLFNSTYTLSSEMAVTDWEKNTSGKVALLKDRMKPTIVMSDDVSGFSDPQFWGPYNVIEPEKSIESAINKIRRKLSKG